MSLWVECQLCKHEYLSLDRQHSCTIARHGMCFHNSSMGSQRNKIDWAFKVANTVN